MKRSRIIAAGVLAAGLVASVGGSANASAGAGGSGAAGGSAGDHPPRHRLLVTRPPVPGKDCLLARDLSGVLDGPGRPDGPATARVQVRDGKIYVDGAVVASVPSDGRPLVIAMRDGRIYVGDEADVAVPDPPPLLAVGIARAADAPGTPSDGPTGIRRADGDDGPHPVCLAKVVVHPGHHEPGKRHTYRDH